MSDEIYKCPKCGREFDYPERCPDCYPASSFAGPPGSPVPPVMSDEEFNDLVDRANQACIDKYHKTLCQLLQEEEAASAQENAQLSERE